MTSTLLLHTLIDRLTIPPIAMVTIFASTVTLSWAYIDAGGIRVTPSSGWIQTVINGLALISILSPSAQALARVCAWTSSYAFGIDAATSTLWQSTRIAFHTHVSIPLETRLTHARECSLIGHTVSMSMAGLVWPTLLGLLLAELSGITFFTGALLAFTASLWTVIAHAVYASTSFVTEQAVFVGVRTVLAP